MSIHAQWYYLVAFNFGAFLFGWLPIIHVWGDGRREPYWKCFLAAFVLCDLGLFVCFLASLAGALQWGG